MNTVLTFECAYYIILPYCRKICQNQPSSSVQKQFPSIRLLACLCCCSTFFNFLKDFKVLFRPWRRSLAVFKHFLPWLISRLLHNAGISTKSPVHVLKYIKTTQTIRKRKKNMNFSDSSEKKTDPPDVFFFGPFFFSKKHEKSCFC